MNFESRRKREERVRNMTPQELLDNLLYAVKDAHVKMGGEYAPYLPDTVQIYFPNGTGDSIKWELLWDAVLDVCVLSWYKFSKKNHENSKNQQKK